MDDNTLKAIERLLKTADFFEATPRNQQGIDRVMDILETLFERVDIKPEQRTGDNVV